MKLATLALLALLGTLTPLAAEETVGKSLLAIVLDDCGAEFLTWTPQGVEAGNPVSTPVLGALAGTGIRFDNLWTAPNCSPTRAMLLTGRYPHRTGMGTAILPDETYELAGTEATIADRLSARGYGTGLFGKHHLGSNSPDQPCDMGFDTWVGMQQNLNNGANYWYWGRFDDTTGAPAQFSVETEYAPTVTTDSAVSWIQAQEGPWFALVSYSLAHWPYHDPPGFSGLTSNLERYRAMIEYLDSEIGRLLGGVDLAETTVLILSDNGVPGQFAMLPNTPEHSKGTAYRGGVETTMLCAGYAVNRAIAGGKNTAGQVLSGHANVVDLYATALRLCPAILPDPGGWPLTDSLTLYSQAGRWVDINRGWNFTERFSPNGVPPGGPYIDLSRACEEGGYKAVWNETGAVELFDVMSDPYEAVDLLLDGTDAYEAAVLAGLEARLVEIGL